MPKEWTHELVQLTHFSRSTWAGVLNYVIFSTLERKGNYPSLDEVKKHPVRGHNAKKETK